MVFRAVEGSIVQQGSVSGTDATPFAATADTRAQLVRIENPLVLLATGVATFQGAGEVVVSQEGINIVISGTPQVDSLNGLIDVVTVAGTGGNTILVGGQTITVSGFLEEFLSASGSLQSQINAVETTDVDSVNSVIGDVSIIGVGTVFVSTASPIITVSGTPDQTDVDSLNTVTGTITLVGVDGNTIITQAQTITVSGFRTEFVNASGSLQTQISAIDSSVTLQEAYDNGTGQILGVTTAKPVTISGANTENVFNAIGQAVFAGDLAEVGTEDKIVNGVSRTHRVFIHEADDFSLGIDSHGGFGTPGVRTYKSGGTHETPVATTTETALGSLASYSYDGTDYGQSARIRMVADGNHSNNNTPARIEFHTVSVGVSSYPASTNGGLRGSISAGGWDFDNHPLTDVGKITAVSGSFSHSLTVSGIPVQLKDIDEVEPSLVGTDGITIISGSNITTVDGFYAEFVSASGSLQSQIDSIDTSGGGGAGHAIIGDPFISVLSGTNTIQLIADAIVGGFGITAASGTDRVTVSVDTTVIATDTDVTSVSGHLQSQINAVEATDVDSLNALTGDIILVGAGTVFVSTAAQTITISGSTHVEKAILGTGSVTVTSGINTVTVSGNDFANLTTVSGIQYITDPTRGHKQLSVSRSNYGFARTGTATGVYLAVGAAVNANAFWVMPRQGTVTSVGGYYSAGPASKFFDLRKNGGSGIKTYTLSPGISAINDSENIDFDQGDRFHVFVSATGTAVTAPTFEIEVAWRL